LTTLSGADLSFRDDREMSRYSSQVKSTAAWVLLALAQLAIFFNNPRHFFMGDSLWWLGHRYQTIGEFLAGFTRIDQGSWYRPLAQRTLGSLLFPLAGLNPIPYRIAGFLLFFACTAGVFLFARYMTENSRIAWLAVLFFAPHVTHVYVTYDVAFTPELLFTLFLIGSAVAYAGYLRHHDRRLELASAALFIGGLLSKETAVALPPTLVLVWLLLPRKDRGEARSLAPYFAILGLYLVFAIGFLHIREIQPRQLIERPGRAGQPGYELVLGRHMFESTDVAFGWAFGIPRSLYTEDMIPERWMRAALKVIRAVICIGAVFVLFTGRRNAMLLGLGWFVVVLLPTLPLLDHFLPYYLFAPLVGFSLAVGTVLDWIWRQSSRLAPGLGAAACAAMLVLSAGIQGIAANNMAETQGLLGGSARNAENSLRDLQALYPAIPRNTLVVIFSEEHPSISWDQAGGFLFQMAYGDSSLVTQYSADGLPFSLDRYDRNHLLAFKWTNAHLVDMTSFVRQRPDLLVPRAPGEFLHLETFEKGLRIPGLANRTATVLYARNGIIQEPLSIPLDGKGEGPFLPGGTAGPGIYTMVAVRGEGETAWFTVSKSITVR
jgi:hypothetical protein